MTIRRGGDWGRLGTPPEDLPSAKSDHEIGEHLGNGLNTMRLCGGDMFATLGGSTSESPTPSLELPIDVMQISYKHSRDSELNTRLASSHCVLRAINARGGWFRGSAVAVMNAQYLGNTINFVRVYNPITYFKGEKVLHPSRMDVRFLRQNDGTKLPFMNEFFDQFETRLDYSKSAYSGDLKKSLYPPGIFHLYGHGEFTMDEEANTPAFQLRYFLSNGATSERRLTGEFPVQRDLVVLNNCFSGLANFLVNEFNRSIPLRILSNGAKAVLVSPSKVDDYFSSEFFKVFYQKIAEGMLFEDAVFFAKNKFYRKHPSMRHPQYWEGFQLIQSYKLSYVPAAHKRDFPWWIFVLSGVVTAAGALLLRHSKIRPRSSKGS